ncbi:MAG TPA: hypothetical protein VLH38_00895 [Patescibacteria group bacterium]|nr:hypothetical protein [Patescibacteria group bacterium]
MSFNTLEGAPVELDEFFDLEQEAVDVFALGEFVLEPLAEVDLASVASEVSTPQGDAIATAAFNSHMNLAPASFQSYVQQF